MQCDVANTRKVPYIHASEDKNDPGDAYKLAELVGRGCCIRFNIAAGRPRRT